MLNYLLIIIAYYALLEIKIQKANAIAIAFAIAICAQQRKVRFNAKNQIFHFLYWQFNFFYLANFTQAKPKNPSPDTN